MERVVININRFGDAIGTRVMGNILRKDIEDKLSDNKTILIFDFNGIISVSNSFADECFGKLIQKHGFDNIKNRIRFTNVSPFVKSVVFFSINQRVAQF